MQNGVALFARYLPSVVNEQIKVDTAVPSLHPHYRDFNTTTSWSAPVPCIGTLTLMRSSHLSFSLNIRTTGSHVPHKSLDQGHATSMPDAARAVSRLPHKLILGYRKPPVLTSSLYFRHLTSGLLALVSLTLTWNDRVSHSIRLLSVISQ